jgi:hypothetical protein
MTPEQPARERIDEQLEQCGWAVQKHTEMNLSAGLGVDGSSVAFRAVHPTPGSPATARVLPKLANGLRGPARCGGVGGAVSNGGAYPIMRLCYSPGSI